MNEYNLKKLQNGSDIRGISLTGVGGSGVPNLRDPEAALLSKGFLLWLCNKTGRRPDELTVAVGRDPRMSGQMLLYGIINGLGPYGVKVLDCGLASTPAMFMSTVFDEIRADGAIMITASHLPYERNGFKYFTADGGDGYRCTISLIVDIAYRMAILNPQLFDKALAETEGIVLIDEIDLHLHLSNYRTTDLAVPLRYY